MSDDYRKDLTVDFNRLEENWRDHSLNYLDWAEKWANAVAKRDRAKEGLDVVKATVSREIRTNAKTKLTEAAISEMVTLDKRYQAATELVIEANEEANILAGAKTAFEHHKKALEGETQLFINGYWSEPRIPAAAKERAYNQKQIEKLNDNPRLKRKIIK